MDVGAETQPIQVVENGRLVRGATARAVVILDAQQYAAAQLPRDPPHVRGIQDVAQVQWTDWERAVQRALAGESRLPDPGFRENLVPAAIVILLVLTLSANAIAILLRNRYDRKW